MPNPKKNNSININSTPNSSWIHPDVNDSNFETYEEHGNTTQTDEKFLVEDFVSDYLSYPEHEELAAFGGDGSSPKGDKSILNDSDTNPASNANLIEDDDLDNEDDAKFEKDTSVNKVSSIYPANQYKNDLAKQVKNTICLWYDGDAEEAARFYAKTFPDSFVGAILSAPGDFPSGKKGDVLTVEFTVMGIPCIGLNGGPGVKHNWAFSFQVATADQAETDRYWNAIVDNDGEENACGWCRDKWGLSWQITPIALTKAITDPDTDAAKRAFDAMMEMQKINIAAIETAHRG